MGRRWLRIRAIRTVDGPAEQCANGRDVEALKNASMPELAQILQFRVDRPVVDQMGSKSRYDFKLQWSTDAAQTTQPDAPPGLFTAIQEEVQSRLPFR
jgi:uncharacterized protein (TIGR03435 family)